MAKAKRKIEDIIAPTMKFEGERNVLFDLLEGDDPVTLKAVGVVGVPGTRDYISFRIILKGAEVIKIEPEEPNLRAIAEEMGKISFVNTFMSEDL